MWKPQNHSGHGGNHDRWMVSYADFVTLLFAVFVVLFASSQVSKDSPAQVSRGVVEALDEGTFRYVIKLLSGTNRKHDQRRTGAGEVPRTAVTATPNLTTSLEVLRKQLAREIATNKVEVRSEPRGLVVSLRQAAFFGSGQAVIQPNTYPIIDKLGAVVKGLPNGLRFEGHTDPIPINNSKYASNWELSAARSIAVLELLVNRHQLDRTRVSIAGFAETLPIGPNDSEEGRARNRRVDLVILREPGQ